MNVGKIISSHGGIFVVKSESGIYNAKARGNFRIKGEFPVVGDNVEFEKNGDSCIITSILQRKNILIRPPISNIDTLFICLSPISPEPCLTNTDKLSAIAVHLDIHPVITLTKYDLDCEKADLISDIYIKSGFDVIKVSNCDKDYAKNAVISSVKGTVCAFAGASGVGKSTLIDLILPEANAEIGDISKKTLRGRHTTKECTLFNISTDKEPIYLADTPGFSLLDFERFFFMERDDLKFAFPEFSQYIGKCKYTKCSHTIEDGCAIIDAVNNGEIQKSRHDSFIQIYNDMKNQKPYKKR